MHSQRKRATADTATFDSRLPPAWLFTTSVLYFIYLLYSGLTELLSNIRSRLAPCVSSVFATEKAGSPFMWRSWGQPFAQDSFLLAPIQPCLSSRSQSSSWWTRKSNTELLSKGMMSSITLTMTVWLQYLAHPFLRTFRPCGSWMKTHSFGNSIVSCMNKTSRQHCNPPPHSFLLQGVTVSISELRKFTEEPRWTRYCHGMPCQERRNTAASSCSQQSSSLSQGAALLSW